MIDHEYTEVPKHVLDAINARILPAMREWVLADRINPEDISHMSFQPHENRRDWVLKVHMLDGRVRIFPINFTVN
jgi:hypothetical protein